MPPNLLIAYYLLILQALCLFPDLLINLSLAHDDSSSCQVCCSLSLASLAYTRLFNSLVILADTLSLALADPRLLLIFLTACLLSRLADIVIPARLAE
jgi:hypothetical protein